MSTATDTLHKKSRDANVVSGGQLVAKALRNEGVDTIFTLCGGHIIDIYDGCRRRRHPHHRRAPRAGRGPCCRRLCAPNRQARLRGDHRRAWLHERGHRYRHGLPLGKSRSAHRRARRAHAAPDGFAPGLAARGHDAANHEIRGKRALDRAHRRHDLHGRPRSASPAPTGPAYLEIPARRARPRNAMSPRPSFRSRASTAHRRNRSAIRAISRSLPTYL